MGLFCKKEKAQTSSTGIYVVEGKKLKPLNEWPEKRSIVGIAESLGYSENKIDAVPIMGDKIIALAFKIETKTPIFVLAKENIPLSYADLKKEITRIK